MGIEKAIFNKLSTDLAVTAYTSTRIFPELSPNQKEYPVIIYDITDTSATINSTGSISSTESLVDILVVATSYDAAILIASLVKTSLDNQKGTWGSVKVIGCFCESESEEVVTITDAQEKKFVIKTLQFKFIH